VDDVLTALGAYEPGQEVRVTVSRDGKELKLPVRFEAP
jgi:hypothetical protein